MGNQLIILGCVGSFNPQLTTELVKFLGERGLEIQHASNRYQGQTHFAVGTGADLAAAFESAEIKTAFVEVASPAETTEISLRTILDAVNQGRKEAQEFFEKRDDKKRAAVSKAPEKKKGPPAEEVPAEVSQVVTPPTAPDAATPQGDETGASAQAEDSEEKPEAEPQPPEGGDVQA